MADETTDIVKTDSAEIVSLPAPVEDVVVLARNPEEMADAQQGLLVWADQKLAGLRHELAEAQENLDIAKTMKIRTEGWRRQVNLRKKRITYYEKAKTALEQGFCIIPDFPVQLIAVRTDKKKPPRAVPKYTEPSVDPAMIPQGEGRYVSDRPVVNEWTTMNGEGKEVTHQTAVNFDDVDFPFKTVRPQILADLSRAVKLKLFDEIGVLPATARRGGDPVLVGRIKRKEGAYNEKVMTFLITWWVDTRTL